MSQPLQHTEVLIYKELQQQTRLGFDMLYNRYSAALYGSIFSIVKNEQDSETILTEVITTAFTRIQLFNPNAQRLPVWMLNMAREKAMAHQKTFNYPGISIFSNSTGSLLQAPAF